MSNFNTRNKDGLDHQSSDNSLVDQETSDAEMNDVEMMRISGAAPGPREVGNYRMPGPKAPKSKSSQFLSQVWVSNAPLATGDLKSVSEEKHAGYVTTLEDPFKTGGKQMSRKPRKSNEQIKYGNQEPQPNPDLSWLVGREDDPEWDTHLKSFNKNWTTLTVVSCAPSAIVFSASIIMSIKHKGWYSISTGDLYNSGSEFQFYKLPAVLVSHFIFAIFMLVTLVYQIALAFKAVRRPWASPERNKIFAKHKAFGWVPAFFVGAAVSLGTISLYNCDIQPKRGSENAFFVLVGICIMVSTFAGIVKIQKHLHGLHMQYMFYACVSIFSPGWNRIVTILIRAYHGALTNDNEKLCFYLNTWTKTGYYYTPSFVVGEIWTLFWWLHPWSPLRAPMFKKYSTGFWLLAFQGMIMSGCVLEFGMANLHQNNDFHCTDEDLVNYQNFAQATKVQGMFQMNSAYGLCAPSFGLVDDDDVMQGVPGIYLKDGSIAHYGDTSLNDDTIPFIDAESAMMDVIKVMQASTVLVDGQPVQIVVNNTVVDEILGGGTATTQIQGGYGG